MIRYVRMILAAVVGLALIGALIWALLPQPVAVDLVDARIAPMAVTVTAEGITRIRDPWQVTAPVTGNTTRSPVEVGDAVVAAETVVAVIQPAEPAFLDARARRLAEAAVVEAEAAVRLAEAQLSRAAVELQHFEAEYDRNRTLADHGTVSVTMLENSAQAAASARAAEQAAQAELELTRATLDRARAQLLGPESRDPAQAPDDCCIRITAPVSGTVLEVADLNARLVQAGSPLLSIGNLDDLEIEVDLLSADTIGIAPGTRAHVERWGGEGVIDARVRRVDPSAFTRVSALGIEEQRVRLTLDILTPPEARAGLGDRYRVYVRLVVWADPAVLQVPRSALFRQDGQWAVFVAQEGRAAMQIVETGRMTADWVQILTGISEGQAVVAYPGARVAEGVRLNARTAGTGD
ncbi:MAG: HlyD family efflux transporter periplasmic adaptor subunit [Rhodobacterales bacterium]|nr:HlyD family efflux transporter periplasmic adaptor subunit [Rhodobacterales bacterium]